MTPQDMERAYNLLALHHSETLSRMMELQHQLLHHHCWYCRWKYRIQKLFKGGYDV